VQALDKYLEAESSRTTPMAALLKEKDVTERERLIMSMAADAASRLALSMLAGAHFAAHRHVGDDEPARG
jgi:hypothetical protein